jgi:D-threo-aldose 1-dehydrogenase
MQEHEVHPPRRAIGASGLSVSTLGFGAAGIGNLYTAVDEPAAQAAVHAALTAGINLFDTAPYYGHGLSEERLGRALRGIPRDRFAVSTKVGRVLDEGAEARTEADGFAITTTRRARFDYTRAGVLRSFESSLQRLNLDRVDILLLHDVGRLTHGDRHDEMLRLALDEALPAMAELKASGACRAIGLGVNEEAVCLEIAPRFDIDCILLAGRYTLLEQTVLNGIMALAKRKSISILAGAPFNSGLLGDPRKPGATYNYQQADAAVLARAHSLYDACAAEHVDIGAAALQFPLAHPAVATVIAGFRSSQEVQIAVSRMQAPIPAALWNRLRRGSLLNPDAPTPGLSDDDSTATRRSAP